MYLLKDLTNNFYRLSKDPYHAWTDWPIHKNVLKCSSQKEIEHYISNIKTDKYKPFLMIVNQEEEIKEYNKMIKYYK